MQTHLYPRKVFVLAATSSSYDDSPSTATSFFVPAMAFVTPASSHWQPLFIKPGGASSPISAGDEDEVVASRWVLQSKDKTAVGEYAILQSLERGWRILWSVKDAV